jgi:hypothetical protein
MKFCGETSGSVLICPDLSLFVFSAIVGNAQPALHALAQRAHSIANQAGALRVSVTQSGGG